MGKGSSPERPNIVSDPIEYMEFARRALLSFQYFPSRRVGDLVLVPQGSGTHWMRIFPPRWKEKSKGVTGKYLFFGDPKELLKIAYQERKWAPQAKISIQPLNGQHCLCLYDQDSSRGKELKNKYKDLYARFKTEEETRQDTLARRQGVLPSYPAPLDNNSNPA